MLDAKDPDSTRWYGWDLAGDLAGDATIAGAAVTETTGGITVGALTVTGTTVHGLVSGGDVGTGRNNATVTLRYATSDGEADVDVTVVIPIRSG